MLNNVFGSQVNDLQRALDRTTERQGLLLTNLANVNVPGYKRKDTDFHITLEKETSGLSAMLEKQRQQQSDASSMRVDGNNVDMEREVVSIEETQLHFEALTQMTAHEFSELRTAIREGK